MDYAQKSKWQPQSFEAAILRDSTQFSLHIMRWLRVVVNRRNYAHSHLGVDQYSKSLKSLDGALISLQGKWSPSNVANRPGQWSFFRTTTIDHQSSPHKERATNVSPTTAGNFLTNRNTTTLIAFQKSIKRKILLLSAKISILIKPILINRTPGASKSAALLQSIKISGNICFR